MFKLGWKCNVSNNRFIFSNMNKWIFGPKILSGEGGGPILRGKSLMWEGKVIDARGELFREIIRNST